MSSPGSLLTEAAFSALLDAQLDSTFSSPFKLPLLRRSPTVYFISLLRSATCCALPSLSACGLPKQHPHELQPLLRSVPLVSSPLTPSSYQFPFNSSSSHSSSNSLSLLPTVSPVASSTTLNFFSYSAFFTSQ
ncbi:hypothetical protein L7F22_044942, partial [Adiantum nelumboides]|nr:hypothetical protein [Adiantum nelumboides]